MIEVDLLPGQYVLAIEVRGSVLKSNSACNLSFYGSGLPDLCEMVTSESVLDYQKKMIKSLALNNPLPTQKTRDYAGYGQPQIVCYSDMIYGINYFYYLNRGTKKLKEQVTMTQLDNLQICKPFQDSKQFEVDLHPGSDAIVLYKYDPSGEQFSFNSVIKAALDEVPGKDFSEFNEQSQLQQSRNLQAEYSSVFKRRDDPPSQLGATFEGKQGPYQLVDLLKFIREHSKQSKRVWNDKEINVFVHHYQHSEGVVILYLNYTEHPYEEYSVVELENLYIENKSEVSPEENVIKFIL